MSLGHHHSECDCAALRTGNPPEILRAEGICSYTEVPAFATLRVRVCVSGSLSILAVGRPAVPSEHGHSPFLCFIKCSFKIRSTSNLSVNVMKLKVGSSQALPYWFNVPYWLYTKCGASVGWIPGRLLCQRAGVLLYNS